MELTLNQALTLAQAEIAKADGPIKNTAIRLLGQVQGYVGKLGIGGAVIMTVADPPKKRSGRGSRGLRKPKAEPKSANSTTDRRS